VAEGDEMRTSAGRVKLTYDDFVRFPDDGKRHELIDGEHVVTPSPSTRHQRICGNLHLLIGNWLELYPIGQVFFAPFDVVLSHVDIVEPDLLYLSNERAAAALTSAHVRGVPELVVEVGSPGTQKRDTTIKRHLYERAGVSEYWFIDAEHDVVRVYRRSGQDFAPAIVLTTAAADVLTTPLLTGLEMPLVRVFKR